MEILHNLFVNWDLSTWANVLEVVGFLGSVATLIIALNVKSKVDKLKTDYILEKRIKGHIDKLTEFTTSVNRHFPNYDNNRHAIITELATLQSELEDLYHKLDTPHNYKTKSLIKFIKSRRSKKFVESNHIDNWFLPKFLLKFTRTTNDDIWAIHSGVHEIIRQLDNIRLNTRNSLR